MSVESAGIAGRGNNERDQAEKAERGVLPAKIGSWQDPEAAIKQFRMYTSLIAAAGQRGFLVPCCTALSTAKRRKLNQGRLIIVSRIHCHRCVFFALTVGRGRAGWQGSRLGERHGMHTGIRRPHAA